MSRPVVQPPAIQWPLNAIRLAIVLVSLLALAFGWGDMLRSAKEAEAAAVEHAREEARIRARAVGELVQATLNGFDFALRSVRAVVADGPAAIERHVQLALRGVSTDFVLQVFIIDREGYLSYSSLGPAPRNYLGDRDYFLRLAAANDDILVISEPVLGRLTQRWSIQVARAIRREGAFEGVVSMALSVDSWTTQLMRLGSGPRDTLSLIGREGQLLLRTLHGTDYYGKQLRLQRPFVLQHDVPEGDYLSASHADGVSRIYGWSRLPSGLITISGLALEDVLAPVRQAREWAIARGALLSGVFLLVIAALVIALGRYGQAMRRLASAEVWQRANFDLVTGLPNRALLLDRLQRMMLHARRHDSQVVVLFIDLDLFKPVNDRFGHAFGDRLLVQVARRLEQLFRSEDTVARLGGDEFVVLMPAVKGREIAEQAAQKIVERLSEPFDIEGQAVDISASVGVAYFPQDGDSPAALIARADAAMYRAKHGGRATLRA